MSGAPQFPIPSYVGAQPLRPGGAAHKAGLSMEQRLEALERGALGRPGPGVTDGSMPVAATAEQGGAKWAGPAAVYLYNPDYAGAATIINSTERLLDWNTEGYDYGGFHAAASSDIVCPTGYGGVYHFDATVRFTTCPAAAHEAYIAVRHYNTSAVLQQEFVRGNKNPAGMNVAVEAFASQSLLLAAGDYIRVSVWQLSGGSLTMGTTIGTSTFTMHRVAVS